MNYAAIKNSAGDEHQTPPRYVYLAREVLGGRIDLDPATTDSFNLLIDASRIYTRRDDALLYTNSWACETMWLNPPFSRGLVDGFIAKFLVSWEAGIISVGAILLVNSSTAANWYQSLMSSCSAFCIPDHRIAFYVDGMPKKGNWYNQTFFYYGERPRAFRKAFKVIGVCR